MVALARTGTGWSFVREPSQPRSPAELKRKDRMRAPPLFYARLADDAKAGTRVERQIAWVLREEAERFTRRRARDHLAEEAPPEPAALRARAHREDRHEPLPCRQSRVQPRGDGVAREAAPHGSRPEE